MGVIDDLKKEIIFCVSDATYHYYPNYPPRIKRIIMISCI
jgi:hypothetical protein